MQLERNAVKWSLFGSLVVAGCGGGNPPSTTPSPAKDSEVRTYIQNELAPYLAAIAEQLCLIKYALAPTTGGEEICTGGPDGYKPPPPNGKP
jgi:hypothetical protein